MAWCKIKHRVTLTLSVIREKILLENRGCYELRNYIMELVPPGDLRMGKMLAISVAEMFAKKMLQILCNTPMYIYKHHHQNN
jgi:hypothetical protein